MDPLAHHLLAHAHNKAWANYRLLGAVARLAPGEFEAARSGFFPSIRATLNHNLTVDWYYIDAIERSRRGQPANQAFASVFEPDVPCATVAELRNAQQAADRRLIALSEPLDAAALRAEIAVPRAGGPTREPLARLLAHLFHHQVHHRGQAHAMLSATTVVPPQLDEFFCGWDAPLRAADFAALGVSEAVIWRAE